MAPGDEPIRTCVGCRRRCPAGDLLRVVVHDGAVVPDVRRLLPGRGASVHPTDACVSQAVRRRAFSRALRQPAADVSALLEFLDDAQTARRNPQEDTGAVSGLDSAPNTAPP